MAELLAIYIQEGFSREQAEEMVLKISQDKDLFLRTLAEKELGISVEGTEEKAPWKDALTMGVAFFIGAMLSVLPYMFLGVTWAIPASIALSLVLLFVLGVVKARVTRTNEWVSGLEVVAVGLSAALIGYALGRWIPIGN